MKMNSISDEISNRIYFKVYSVRKSVVDIKLFLRMQEPVAQAIQDIIPSKHRPFQILISQEHLRGKQ